MNNENKPPRRLIPGEVVAVSGGRVDYLGLRGNVVRQNGTKVQVADASGETRVFSRYDLRVIPRARKKR